MGCPVRKKLIFHQPQTLRPYGTAERLTRFCQKLIKRRAANCPDSTVYPPPIRHTVKASPTGLFPRNPAPRAQDGTHAVVACSGWRAVQPTLVCGHDSILPPDTTPPAFTARTRLSRSTSRTRLLRSTGAPSPGQASVSSGAHANSAESGPTIPRHLILPSGSADGPSPFPACSRTHLTFDGYYATTLSLTNPARTHGQEWPAFSAVLPPAATSAQPPASPRKTPARSMQVG